MEISLRPQFFIETLLKEQFLSWSTTILNKQQPPGSTLYSVLGVDRNVGGPRSRDLELFQLGLLLGRLNDDNRGWSLLRQDKPVHTTLGYIAYALIRAREQPIATRAVEHATSALYPLFLLQVGVSTENRSATLFSLYEHFVESFPIPVGVDPGAWSRFQASVFGSVCTKTKDERLLDTFAQGQRISELQIELEGPNRERRTVTPQNAISIFQGHREAISPVRFPNYWLGPAHPGWYPEGLKGSTDLLRGVREMEQRAAAAGHHSPLYPLINKPDSEQQPCILEHLSGIFLQEPKTAAPWRSLVKTLIAGVRDALQFLEGEERTPKTFYVRDVIEGNADSEELKIEVESHACPGIPQRDDHLVIEQRVFIIREVAAEGEKLVLTVAAA